jgi:O-acetyl-ADP-ribose deacetylase (regulator of RNase III)
MVEETKGNLLEADVEALVNTVNTVGVMGKGVALQFKQAFPDNFRAYEAACRRGDVKVGRMFVFHRSTFHNPKVIINFPTKRHWRGKSQVEYIDRGLRDLVRVIKAENIKSVALPPLGCGSGGLDWNEVRPRIESAFDQLPDVRALLYVPEVAPPADQMKVATTAPKMTPGRAAVLLLMDKYLEPGYGLTLLEIQKLAYLLQESGEPLKLGFTKQQFGPYTETLHHVLQRLEGHFIRGYGDRTQSVSISLLPGAAAEARSFLRGQRESEERFRRVEQLIEGLETPYGLELLTTVHWVAAHENPVARRDWEAALKTVHSWSERKRLRFRPEHVKIAWTRLADQGWM